VKELKNGKAKERKRWNGSHHFKGEAKPWTPFKMSGGCRHLPRQNKACKKFTP